MRLLTSALIGASVLVTGNALQAQIYLPELTQLTEGNDGQNRIFENAIFHGQQVVDGAALGLNQAGDILLINTLAYRADSNFSSGIPDPAGATFTDVTIKLYKTAITPDAIPTDFAANIAASTELTPGLNDYDCTAAGPDADINFAQWIPVGSGTAAPWEEIDLAANNGGVVIAYDPAMPNLLIDIDSATAPGVTINLDGSRQGGHDYEYGTSSPVAMPDPFGAFRLQVSSSSTIGTNLCNQVGMTPGDGYQLFATVPSYLANAPAVIQWGFGAIPAPVDLGAFIPGAFFYTSNAVSTPATWVFSPIQGTTILQDINVSLNTPVGFQFQAQVALIDSMLPTSQIQVALSNGVDMWIGDGGVGAGAKPQPLGQIANSNGGTVFEQFGTSACWGGTCMKIN